MLNITEIRIKLVPNDRDKLRAFASITLDGSLVVRDIKIIDGGDRLFVAMPSRKLCDRCQRCGAKNYIRARYCNECGARLRTDRSVADERGRPRLYADVAHPIHQESRDQIQNAILEAYQLEYERSKQAGYVPRAATDDHEDFEYDFTS